MASWLIDRPGWSLESRPDICSGDQPSFSFVVTYRLIMGSLSLGRLPDLLFRSLALASAL